MNIIPLIGAYPISHMGHYTDLYRSLEGFKDETFVGISDNNDIFNKQDRLHIIKSQWGHPENVSFVFVKSAGETLATARLLDKQARVCRLVGGLDRRDFILGLLSSLEQNKIKEMNEYHLTYDSHEIYLVDGRYSHGLSGTRMREAVKYNDKDVFLDHLGRNVFPKKEADEIWNKLREANEKGELKIKRK